MDSISVTIRRFIMRHQPNIVEATFIDAWGQSWTFHDKAPMFMADYLDEESFYPQQGNIACEILAYREHDGRQIITVTTEKPWHIESTSGEVQFDIVPEQLIKIDEQ